MPEAVQGELAIAHESAQQPHQCLWCRETFWWPRNESFTPCLCIWCFVLNLPARRRH